MVVLNLKRPASELCDQLNAENKMFKVKMNLGGFAWVVDSSGLCVETGFCLIGNSDEVQRAELKRLASVLGVIAIIV